MSKGKGKSAEEVNPSMPKAQKRPLLLRPHHSPLELEFLSWRELESPCQPTQKGIALLGFHLLGVGIVIITACFLLANIFQNAAIGSLFSAMTSTVREPTACAGIQQCLDERAGNRDGASSAMKVTPIVFGQTPIPTVEVRPDPTLPVPATHDPTTPLPLLLAAPMILTVSRFDTCNPGRPAPLVLTNKSGTTLLWSEDTTKTSRGISVTDPKGAYLILPGKSARVMVWCRRNLPMTNYALVINFNGGSVSIQIDVTK